MNILAGSRRQKLVIESAAPLRALKFERRCSDRSG
jgi:hypothetical protein